MRFIVQAVALLVLPASVMAQGARITLPPPPNASQSVRMSLPNTGAGAGAVFRGSHAVCAECGFTSLQAGSQGVTIVVISATQRAWSAKGTWDKSPGRSCVVYFGYTTDVKPPITEFEGRRPKQEGEPACDPM